MQVIITILVMETTRYSDIITIANQPTCILNSGSVASLNKFKWYKNNKVTTSFRTSTY
jgi:hypothetical protein